MKLWELEAALQHVKGFDKPNYKLEQYPTSSHLAAQIMFIIEQRYSDIDECSVGDLGCGSGMLTVASSMMGASHNVAFEVDPSAIVIAKENFADFELEVDIVQVDIVELAAVLQKQPAISDAVEPPVKPEPAKPSEDEVEDEDDDDASGGGSDDEKQTDTDPLANAAKYVGVVDTIVMNPPFGTRKQGVDMVFLQAALCMAKKAVYSLHKTSTRKYILKKAQEWGVEAEVLCEVKFDIPKMYKFHKKKSLDVQVDLIRFAHPKAKGTTSGAHGNSD